VRKMKTKTAITQEKRRPVIVDEVSPVAGRMSMMGRICGTGVDFEPGI